ncbi:MAG: 2-oxo-acid dehydrogenase component family protein, partial [Actinobacteria bacterium]|nr:2-oxo-acid dehydrogenase component family protein [Actinomycetota bacterium]
LYRWAAAPEGMAHRAAILFSGPAQRAARQAQAELAEHYGVGAELWSATSYKQLREEALSVERWNRLHPADQSRLPFVTRALAPVGGPVVAVTDYLKMVPDQVARWVPGRFLPLGTDGYGRSDTREALRRFFEVDAHHVVVAVLSALAAEGKVEAGRVADAIARYGIDPELPDPRVS